MYWVAIRVAVLSSLAAFAAYSNSLDGAFALDDWHTIEQNPAVRGLHHIPRYFSDPQTFSVLPANVDYRPVLQATYAVNYAISPEFSGTNFGVPIHFARELLPR